MTMKLKSERVVRKFIEMNGKLARFFVSFHVRFVVSEPDFKCTGSRTKILHFAFVAGS